MAGPETNNNNQYDFILNPEQPKSSEGIFGPDSSKATKIALVIVGAILLIILIAVFMNLLTRGSKQATNRLLGIAQEQAEISRVAAIGIKNARTDPTQGYANSVKLTIDTSQQDILALLRKRGVKVEAKILNKKQNQKTDKQLEDARLTNRFDDVFSQIIHSQVASYRSHLEAAYKDTTSTSEKDTLKRNIASADILLGKQLKQPSQSNTNTSESKTSPAN